MNKLIFNNIEEKDISKIIKNLDAKIISYDEKRAIDNNHDNLIGIILEGTANIEKYDYNGNKIIIEKLDKNSFFFLYLKNDISVITTSKCQILIFEYENLFKNLKNTTLVNNIMNLFITKTINLNTRIELLSKRTIKDKVLTYFKILSKENHNKVFNLPYTYTELADYLAVDRSALMREIKKLKDKGFIKTNNRKIKLIKTS